FGGISMSAVRVFASCNSGHYFVGNTCLFDGWSSDHTREIAAAAERISGAGRIPSLAELAAEGVSEEALAGALVIDFSSSQAALDAIALRAVIARGTYYRLE